jgi:hypothetical protein
MEERAKPAILEFRMFFFFIYKRQLLYDCPKLERRCPSKNNYSAVGNACKSFKKKKHLAVTVQ